MIDVKSVICDHLDLSFLRGLKIGSLNFVGLHNARSSVFTKDEIKQMINNDVLIYAISHNILSVDKRNITKKVKDIQSRFGYVLKSIKSDDIKKYIAKKHKSYNENQANELYQKILDFLSQDTSYITIMSYIVFNRLKDVVNNAKKLVDDTKLDLHLASSDGNKRDVVTVFISDRIRDYFKNKLTSFLKEREKNLRYVSYFVYYFLSELINSDLRALNNLKDYANMLNSTLLLMDDKSDCSLNKKAIELVEERTYKNVNYSVALIGPIHLSILDYLDRVNLSTEEILDIAYHTLSSQISSELEKLRGRIKKDSYGGGDRKDLYKTARTRINFAGTEIGKFAKEIYDELTNHPIARVFKYLFKLSASIGKAIDVRFGTGRGADLISRIESFVNDWELNLGDTEYSDLIRARKAAMKKKPSETEYSSKSETVTTTESVKQSKISSILSGSKPEVKDKSLQSSEIKTTESKVEQEISEKEASKKEKPEIKSKPVSDQNVDLFKKIHEDILVIKNMLISSGAALSGQKNVKTDTQIQNVFQNICQSKKRDDHDKPDEEDDDKKEDKEKDKDQEKESLEDNKKESTKGGEAEKSHVSDVYKNILQKGGNMNVPHPSTIESKPEASGVGSELGAEAHKYPSLSEIKQQSDIKLERGLPKDMGKTPTSPTSGGDACKIGDQDKDKQQQQQQQQNQGERRNFVSMFGGKGQTQVTTNTQTTYNIASSTTIQQSQEKEQDRKTESSGDNKNEGESEGGGITVGSIFKILVSGLAVLMTLVFGALAVTFFVKMIKKLFMPDVEFSGGNIDFQKLSEMSEEQKNKLKSGIENRYKALAARKFDARAMNQLHEYTGLSAGAAKPSELIVQSKDSVKPVSRTAPTREEFQPNIEEQKKYDVLEKTESLEKIRESTREPNYEEMYARLSAVERTLVESLTSHTRYNEALAKMIENTYRESEMIKNKRPEELEQP